MRLIAAAAFLVCGSAWVELSTDYIFDPDDGRYESEGAWPVCRTALFRC
ncbi:hypothetical protein SAMN05216256_10260 [Halopseudomonas pachastrellae]|nr:hypothetical protein SAMN05216256_10260 [Halopseudomonas pachastrellae]